MVFSSGTPDKTNTMRKNTRKNDNLLLYITVLIRISAGWYDKSNESAGGKPEKTP
jgi:hypothetical protein